MSKDADRLQWAIKATETMSPEFNVGSISMLAEIIGDNFEIMTDENMIEYELHCYKCSMIFKDHVLLKIALDHALDHINNEDSNS